MNKFMILELTFTIWLQFKSLSEFESKLVEKWKAPIRCHLITKYQVNSHTLVKIVCVDLGLCCHMKFKEIKQKFY